ncbi:MAG: flagellar hook-basal body complex protein FliE [Planctomycetes bacterium]|nr:flagellar hook-basal body complex protein FliE [Planctomycetota bacterium]
MTGIDLPGIGGFDVARYQREMMRAMQKEAAAVMQAPKVQQERTEEQEPATSFESFLGGAVDNVQGLQDDVRAKVRGMVLGEGVELHDVMIAAQKSDTAMSLMLEVRNKMVDAWEKLSRSVM